MIVTNAMNATEETNTRSKVQVHCFQKGLQTDDATGSRGFVALAGAGSGETEVVGDTESRSETYPQSVDDDDVCGARCFSDDGEDDDDDVCATLTEMGFVLSMECSRWPRNVIRCGANCVGNI